MKKYYNYVKGLFYLSVCIFSLHVIASDFIKDSCFTGVYTLSTLLPENEFEAYCNGQDIVYKGGKMLYFCSLVNQKYGKKSLDKEILEIGFEFEGVGDFVPSLINVTCVDELGFCWRRILFPILQVAERFEKVTVKINEEKTLYATLYGNDAILVFSSDGTFVKKYNFKDKIIDFSFLQKNTLRIFFAGGEYTDKKIVMEPREKKPDLKVLLQTNGYIVYKTEDKKLLFWDKMQGRAIRMADVSYRDKEIANDKKSVLAMVDDCGQKEYFQLSFVDKSIVLFDIQENKVEVVQQVVYGQDYVAVKCQGGSVWLIDRETKRITRNFVRKNMVDSTLKDVKTVHVFLDIDSQHSYLYVSFSDGKGCVIDIETGEVSSIESMFPASLITVVKTPHFKLIADFKNFECIKISPKASCAIRKGLDGKRQYIVLSKDVEKVVDAINKDYYLKNNKLNHKEGVFRWNIKYKNHDRSKLKIKEKIVRAFEVDERGLRYKERLKIVQARGDATGAMYVRFNKGVVLCFLWQIGGRFKHYTFCSVKEITYITSSFCLIHSGNKVVCLDFNARDIFFSVYMHKTKKEHRYQLVTLYKNDTCILKVFHKKAKIEICELRMHSILYKTCADTFVADQANVLDNLMLNSPHFLKSNVSCEIDGDVCTFYFWCRGRFIMSMKTRYNLGFKKRSDEQVKGAWVCFSQLRKLFPRNKQLTYEIAEKVRQYADCQCWKYNNPDEYQNKKDKVVASSCMQREADSQPQQSLGEANNQRKGRCKTGFKRSRSQFEDQNQSGEVLLSSEQIQKRQNHKSSDVRGSQARALRRQESFGQVPQLSAILKKAVLEKDVPNKKQALQILLLNQMGSRQEDGEPPKKKQKKSV